MNCNEIETLLNTHGVSALTAARRADAMTHLEQCRRCADAWRVAELLAQDAPVAPPPDLYRRIRAQLGGAPAVPAPASRRAPTWLVPLTGVAAALALAVLALFALPGTGPAPTAGGVGTTPTTTAVDLTAERAATVAPSIAGDTPVRGTRFRAGQHYEILATPAPPPSARALVRVLEFFMYGCVHCYECEPYLQAWHSVNERSIELVRVPVMWNATAALQARAFYTAEVLGRVDDLHDALFDTYHARGAPLRTVDDVENIFARHGIDRAAFRRAFDGAEVAALVAEAIELNRRYGIESTPTFIVGERFRTDAGRAGSYDELFVLLSELAAEVRTAPRPATNLSDVLCRVSDDATFC